MDSARPKVVSVSGALVEIAMITVGVLIALSFDSLAAWRSDRALLREARANLLNEIRDNRAELEGALQRADTSTDAMIAALERLDPPQTADQTRGQTVSLALSLADLNSASRASAGLTGAMALMDYEEVKAYASVYSHQELFLETQKEALQHLTRALGLADVFENPAAASAGDLDDLKRDIRLCLAALTVGQQFGQSLMKEYDEVLLKR